MLQKISRSKQNRVCLVLPLRRDSGRSGFSFLGSHFQMIEDRRIPMDPAANPWLHRFAVLTAVATLMLIIIGGLVTSHGVGMAVPDWPNTYGYNMFLFPFS